MQRLDDSRTTMTRVFLFSLLSLNQLLSGSSNPDPCIFSNHKNLTNDGGRSTKCGKIGARCDHYIETDWYRTPDATIASVCPDLLHCGVTYPVWMNGTLPKEAEGIVNRTGCMVTGLSPKECCPVNTTNTISVKNCSTFFVYYLERRIGCDEGYCFDTSLPCPTTSKVFTTTTSALSTRQENSSNVKTLPKDQIVSVAIGLAILVPCVTVHL